MEVKSCRRSATLSILIFKNRYAIHLATWKLGWLSPSQITYRTRLLLPKQLSYLTRNLYKFMKTKTLERWHLQPNYLLFSILTCNDILDGMFRYRWTRSTDGISLSGTSNGHSCLLKQRRHWYFFQFFQRSYLVAFMKNMGCRAVHIKKIWRLVKRKQSHTRT